MKQKAPSFNGVFRCSGGGPPTFYYGGQGLPDMLRYRDKLLVPLRPKIKKAPCTGASDYSHLSLKHLPVNLCFGHSLKPAYIQFSFLAPMVYTILMPKSIKKVEAGRF